MAFGLAVADYNEQTGAIGKMIKVDVSTYQPYNINYVQGESSGNVKGDSITSPTLLSALMNYLEATDCPDIAFSYASEVLTIFFKTGVYDTRFAFGGNRMCQKVSSDTDLMDVPKLYLALCGLYAREIAWLSKKGKVDRDIKNQIEEKEFAITS